MVEVVEVITLGTSSPYPRPDDPCSSFLVVAGNSRLWLDAGAGTLGALLRHCPLTALDAVWISHTHADHFSDLATTFYALRYADVERPPLTVFGPTGWAERLRAFLTHTDVPSPLEDVFDVREVHDRQQVIVGELDLTAVEVRHDTQCFGVRISHGPHVVSYTGDSGPCDGLDVLADGTDLLISEAGHGIGSSDAEDVHLTAAHAGRVARDGGVGALLLTHLAASDPGECVRAALAGGAPGVTAARPGERTVVATK